MRKYLILASLLLAACNEAADTVATAPVAEVPAAETAEADTPTEYKTLDGQKPIIIAHRGASGLYPEHTLKAYQTAIDQGADFIEPDLVMTKDGVLVANHDGYLSDTTNIAEHDEFADRKTVRKMPMGDMDDWWSDDFTLAELKTLKAIQRVEGRSHDYDGQYDIVTFDEIIDLVLENAEKGRIVGLHIEAKWPSNFSAAGLDMVDPILDTIARRGLREAGIPVFIQCFEPGFLAQVAAKSDLPLVQNIVGPPYAELLGLDMKLEDIPTMGVGPHKAMILTETGGTTDYVDRAHALGKVVHVYTVRDDDPAEGFETAEQELKVLIEAGVDGIWTDYPATAIAVRDEAE
ncbi:glycerophosphodiester phosphodiesterase family protein [Hyphomonas sp.]|uniref:glycerophosphodiester phosphodiesterase family protein n=1 Tax=Hyphomonas sp. TaxID=87 RepID=UPI003002DFE9